MCIWRNALLFLSLFLVYLIGFSQNERIADSLKSLHRPLGEANYDLQILLDISINETNPDSILKYSELLIIGSENESNLKMAHNGYLQKGNALRLKGNLDLALDAFFKSLEYAQSIDYKEGEAKLHISIADIYSENQNHKNASIYYQKGIKLLRNSSDSLSLAKALINSGDEYFNIGKLDSALKLTRESEIIFNSINSKIGQAYSLGNLGMIYAELGEHDLAERNISNAITLLEDIGEFYPIAVYLTYMSDIYWEKGANKQALEYANKSLELARKYGLKEQISTANLKLSELYEKLNQPMLSLQHYKAHVAFRDSVNNIETVQQMADLRTDFEVSQKQVEVDLLNQQRKNQRIINFAAAITSVLIILLAFGMYRRYKYIKATKRIIEDEKDRSEKLLLNILPEETAKELKAHGAVKATKFESATVLFTDFKGFTALAEQGEPELLVRSIDFYFKAFDEITSKYGLEKIKTIGDSYMCAGGIPVTTQDHAKNVMLAANEMINFVNAQLQAQNDLIHFEIRIGVHTGPVIAGIVGNKKWQYDVWGDTVNIASRMESKSEAGRINISETTYLEIKEMFECEYRGKLEVKNRGSLKMYFLKNTSTNNEIKENYSRSLV